MTDTSDSIGAQQVQGPFALVRPDIPFGYGIDQVAPGVARILFTTAFGAFVFHVNAEAAADISRQLVAKSSPLWMPPSAQKGHVPPPSDS